MKWLPEQIITIYTDCTLCYSAGKSSPSQTAGQVSNTPTAIKPGGLQGGGGERANQGHAEPPLHSFYSLYGISLFQTSGRFLGFHSRDQCNHIFADI